MFFEALAIKKTIDSIPWRWVLIGLATVLIGVAGWYAVHSYRQEVAARVVAEKRAAEVEEDLQKERATSGRLRTDIDRMTEYMVNAEMRRLQRDAQLRKLAARRTKRDATGDIAPDDELISDLNGLFSAPAAAAGAVQTRYSAGAAVPR